MLVCRNSADRKTSSHKSHLLIKKKNKNIRARTPKESKLEKTKHVSCWHECATGALPSWSKKHFHLTPQARCDRGAECAGVLDGPRWWEATGNYGKRRNAMQSTTLSARELEVIDTSEGTSSSASANRPSTRRDPPCQVARQEKCQIGERHHYGHPASCNYCVSWTYTQIPPVLFGDGYDVVKGPSCDISHTNLIVNQTNPQNHC